MFCLYQGDFFVFTVLVPFKNPSFFPKSRLVFVKAIIMTRLQGFSNLKSSIYISKGFAYELLLDKSILGYYYLLDLLNTDVLSTTER
jgi:hypothetical protein